MKKSLFCFKNTVLISAGIFSVALPAVLYAQSLENVNNTGYSSGKETGQVTQNLEVQESEEKRELIPVLLEGIWENRTRYVVFDSGYVSRLSSRRIPTLALKAFYGWYVDRSAESDEYSIEHKRPSNDTTSKNAQQLEIHFEPISYELNDAAESVDYNGVTISKGKEGSGAWDMQIKYPGIKEIYHIPVAVIGNELYLNFLYRTPENLVSNCSYTSHEDFEGRDLSSVQGFWQDSGAASGIMISPPVLAKELTSYYVIGTNIYQLRYWETDMEYDSVTKAAFSDGEKTYYVPKHLISGNRVFTCVAGRGRTIRNIKKTNALPEQYKLNEVLINGVSTDSSGVSVSIDASCPSIIGVGEPYLTLVEGSRTFEDILEEAALRKAPSPAPLFPPHGLLDFDWSIIEDPPASYDRRMLDLGK